MSPDTADQPASSMAVSEAERLTTLVGERLRERRRQLGWTIEAVALRAGVAVATVQKIETGARGSLEMYVRLAEAVGMSFGMMLATQATEASESEVDDQMLSPSVPPTGRKVATESDLVHATMGEVLLDMLASGGFECGVDEPWRNYQYSGRADVVAWDRPRRALLHSENRTAFPDVQDALGRFNGKRAYLAGSLWERLGMDGPPSTETHAIVALWSLEVLETLRAYPGTFRAACPNPPDAFLAWLAGTPPKPGVTSTLVLFDPFATGSQPRFASLREALDGAKPRIEGYAAAAALLRARRSPHPGPGATRSPR